MAEELEGALESARPQAIDSTRSSIPQAVPIHNETNPNIISVPQNVSPGPTPAPPTDDD